MSGPSRYRQITNGDTNADELIRELFLREMRGEIETLTSEVVDDSSCTGCRYTDVRKEDTSNTRPKKPKTDNFEHESLITDLKSKGVTIGKTIGEGSYSKVKKAFVNRLNGNAAVKIITLDQVPNDFLEKFLPREVNILRRIRHPNITKLLDIIYVRNKICLLMELAPRGDLLKHIQRHRHIKENHAKVMLHQILDAVQYLHVRGYFHRDLKCENILLHENLTVKLSDFGFTREWSEANRLCNTFCGSSSYASPEILRGIAYDPHDADIWSIGVILFVMIIGSMPYDDSNVTKMLAVMDSEEIPFPENNIVSNEAVDLIKSILRKEPRKRATINQILEHAWINPTR